MFNTNSEALSNLDQITKINLQNNENIVLQSQATSVIEREIDNQMPDQANKKQFKNDSEFLDPFAPVEALNLEGLSPDQIRELMGVCADSYEHSIYSEEGEDDGQPREYIC